MKEYLLFPKNFTLKRSKKNIEIKDDKIYFYILI